MFRILCKIRVQIHCSNGSPASHLPSLQIFSLRSLSATSQPREPPSSITVGYLVSFLGFSPESALAAAKKIDLKSTSRPDSVLKVFQDYGFTKTHIREIIARHPSLLLADADENLKPKLEFLCNNGISGLKLAEIISADPFILRRSLRKQLIPCLGLLKSFFGTSNEILSLFSVRRGTWVLHKFTETMASNIETLRSYGVPDSGISKMMMVRPRTLSRNADEFTDTVREIKEMGFDPSSLMFIHGVCTLAGMKRQRWESKLEAFKSFGWSEGEVKALFVRQPKFMDSSEEKIRKALDFFMNRLQWTRADIAKYPLVLFLSFDKRIVPRSGVLQHLISKGLIYRSSMGRALMVTEDRFLNDFVMNYQDEIPQLLEIYQNEKKLL